MVLRAGARGICTPAQDRRGLAISWTPPPAELDGCWDAEMPEPIQHPERPFISAEPASARSGSPVRTEEQTRCFLEAEQNALVRVASHFVHIPVHGSMVDLQSPQPGPRRLPGPRPLSHPTPKATGRSTYYLEVRRGASEENKVLFY